MNNEVAKVEKDPLRALVKKMEPEIRSALPSLGVTVNRLSRVFMTCVRKNPKLMACSQQSLAASLMQSAELGLEPGSALGHIWLIPYGKECTPIIGYRGLVELMRRSGEIKSMSVNVVYEADKFEYKLGLNEDLVHIPSKNPVNERGEVTYSYFVAHFMSGGFHLEVLDRSEIDQIRSRSMGKNSDPWKQHFPEMAKKCAIRRAAKLMPLKIVPAEAFENLEREDVLEADFTEQPETPELTAGKIDIKKKDTPAEATAQMPSFNESPETEN